MEPTREFFYKFLFRLRDLLKLDESPSMDLDYPYAGPLYIEDYVEVRNGFYDAYGIDYYSVPDSKADSKEVNDALESYYEDVLNGNIHPRHKYGLPPPPQPQPRFPWMQ